MWLESLIVNFLNRRPRSRPAANVPGLIAGVAASNPKQPIVWPNTLRAQHLGCVGKSGYGKTHWLLWLATQLMRSGEAFVFFDYHADATRRLIELAAQEPRMADRLLLIDPTDVHASPGLNLLEVEDGREETALARSSELATILKRRWQVESFGARTEELLRNTLFTLSVGGYTLVEAPLLLTSRTFRQQLVQRLTHPEALDYWRTRYEPLSDPMKAAFREPLLNKITGFLAEPACRHFLGQRRSTFTFAAAAANGCAVVVNLSKGHLREHAHTLGNLIFARLQFEILARARMRETQRELLTVFADEAQNLAENDLITLLAEGRKFRASLVVATQFSEQLPRELRQALFAAGSHVFFQVSAADAGALAAELSVDLRSRYQKQLSDLSRGTAIAKFGNAAPVELDVPRLPQRQAMIDPARLHAHSLAQVSRPRPDIEAEIRQRRSQGDTARPLINPTQHGDNEGQEHW